MTASTLITSSPITDQQKDHLVRLASDATKKVIRNLRLDSASAQRVAMRFDEVTVAMSAKVAEVSLDSTATTCEQKRAHEIMGKNFLGIEVVAKHYGMAYSQEQLAALATIPFAEATLKECKDSHLLVAGFPMTILEIRAKVPKKPMTFCEIKDTWYDRRSFAAWRRVDLRWYLIRKDIIANSTDKASYNQNPLLAENEEVPWACELIYAIVLFFLAKGDRSLENVFARCGDLDSGHYISVGRFDSDGFKLCRNLPNDVNDDVGIASSRKPIGQ